MKYVLVTTNSEAARELLASYENAKEVYVDETHIIWMWQSDADIFDAVTEVLTASNTFRSSTLLAE